MTFAAFVFYSPTVPYYSITNGFHETTGVAARYYTHPDTRRRIFGDERSLVPASPYSGPGKIVRGPAIARAFPSRVCCTRLVSVPRRTIRSDPKTRWISVRVRRVAARAAVRVKYSPEKTAARLLFSYTFYSRRREIILFANVSKNTYGPRPIPNHGLDKLVFLSSRTRFVDVVLLYSIRSRTSTGGALDSRDKS